MKKNLKIFGIFILLLIIMLPIKNVSAWQYSRKVVQLSDFTDAKLGYYQLSKSIQYEFRGRFWFHQISNNGKYYHGYCLHAGKRVYNDTTVTMHSGFDNLISQETNKKLTASQQELLKNIVASGYQNGEKKIEGSIVNPSSSMDTTCKSRSACQNVLVTQILVWEVMEYARTNYNYNPNNLSNNTYKFVSSDSALKSKYEKILDTAKNLSDPGKVPAAFGQTYTLKWSDSKNRYESGLIDVGDYNLDKLPDGVKWSKESGKIRLYTTSEISKAKEVSFKMVKGSTSSESLSFRWFRFSQPGQDVLMGDYKREFTQKLKVITESGPFKIYKRDNDTKEYLKGAQFKIYKCSSISKCSTKASHTADLTQDYKSEKFELKKSGLYLFTETKTPDGYATMEDFFIKFTIKNDNTVTASMLQSTTSSSSSSDLRTSIVKISKADPSCLHIVVYNESKKISVKKVDGETNKAINGATFKIKDEQGNYLKFNKVNDSYMYSSTGKIDTLYDASKSSYTISALPTGKYYVEETNVPYPYILSGTQKERQTAFKIDSKNYLTVYNYTKKKYEKSPDASITIKNYKTKVELVKKGKKNAKLPYVEFELYNSDKTKQITVTKTGDGIYTYPENGTGTPIKLITGSSGKITIYNLPVGKYNIKEVKAADGYLIDPSVEWKEITVEVKRDGQTSPIGLFEWPNTQGEFCFYKMDEDGNYINDGKFKIQSYDEKTGKYNDVALNYDSNDKMYSIDEQGKSNLYVFSPIENGETCFKDVKTKGKYRVVEIEAPAGFKLSSASESKAEFTVNSDGYVLGNTTIINKKDETGEGSESQAELIINISTGQTVVKYGLIISVIAVAIIGLLILNKKMSKK